MKRRDGWFKAKKRPVKQLGSLDGRNEEHDFSGMLGGDSDLPIGCFEAAFPDGCFDLELDEDSLLGAELPADLEGNAQVLGTPRHRLQIEFNSELELAAAFKHAKALGWNCTTKRASGKAR